MQYVAVYSISSDRDAVVTRPQSPPITTAGNLSLTSRLGSRWRSIRELVRITSVNTRPLNLLVIVALCRPRLLHYVFVRMPKFWPGVNLG